MRGQILSDRLQLTRLSTGNGFPCVMITELWKERLCPKINSHSIKHPQHFNFLVPPYFKDPKHAT